MASEYQQSGILWSLEVERTPLEKLLGSAQEGINIARLARSHTKNEGKSVSKKKEIVILTNLTNTFRNVS